MANSSKAKGDRAELEAVDLLVRLAPDLVVSKPQRMLGAGRLDDVGDLRVFDDVAIQVRNYKAASIGTALRSSAVDAVQQSVNGEVRFALGLVPIPGARKDKIRWLAACVDWPFPTVEDPVHFGLVSRAVTWIREADKFEPSEREQRLARLGGAGTPVYVAPIEAWLNAYRSAREVCGISTTDVRGHSPHETQQRHVNLRIE